MIKRGITLKSNIKTLLCAALLSTPMFAMNAQADTYPSRPITVTTPTAAGGGTDIVARIVAEKIAPILGQPIVINNKPGAGGVIGNQMMKREANDGYSLFLTANSNQLIAPWVYKNVNFDPINDYEPVATVGFVPHVLVVHPSFPAHTFGEFVEEIKKNPGKYYYSSGGNGTINHLMAEMVAQRVGTKLEHIPYKAISAALTDVMSGEVPMIFTTVNSAIEYIKSGKLRPLVAGSSERLTALPDVPTIKETYPDFFDTDMWVAVYAPKGTPRERIDVVYQAIDKALADPDLQDRFKTLGVRPGADGPDELAKRQEYDYAQWEKIVKSTGANAN